MIFMMLLLLIGNVFAEAPTHWNQLSEIRDRHEFYPNNEMVVKPRESWQTLFSVVYTDVNLVQAKDCVFYKVPGDNPGILKLKTISADDACEKFLLSAGDKEWTEIRSLHFATLSDRLTLDMTFPQYLTEKWEVNFQNNFKRPEAKMHLSSSDFKSPKLILLAPATQGIKANRPHLKNQTVCHEVNDECEVIKPSICSQCEEGWYEIPNGCEVGPKYCGRVQCGLKNAPACRRGLKWQREEKTFDCRTDSSFAFCSKGLEVHCQGRQAFCR